jgi:hypothetical protein
MSRWLLIGSAVAALACGGGGMDVTAQPVPADKIEYVGSWHGEGVDLVITADGMVDYQSSGANGSGQMTAPITAWTDEGFTAGISFLTMSFVVSEPPHEVDGAWKMTVDGVELTRGDEGEVDVEAVETDLPLVLTPQ